MRMLKTSPSQQQSRNSLNVCFSQVRSSEEISIRLFTSIQINQCWSVLIFFFKSWNDIIYFLLPNAHPWFLDNLVTKNILSFPWLLSYPQSNITLITHCLTNSGSHCSVCSRSTSQNHPILAYNCITFKKTLHLK